jgi:hypothetical protein
MYDWMDKYGFKERVSRAVKVINFSAVVLTARWLFRMGAECVTRGDDLIDHQQKSTWVGPMP